MSGQRWPDDNGNRAIESKRMKVQQSALDNYKYRNVRLGAQQAMANPMAWTGLSRGFTKSQTNSLLCLSLPNSKQHLESFCSAPAPSETGESSELGAASYTTLLHSVHFEAVFTFIEESKHSRMSQHFPLDNLNAYVIGTKQMWLCGYVLEYLNKPPSL